MSKLIKQLAYEMRSKLKYEGRPDLLDRTDLLDITLDLDVGVKMIHLVGELKWNWSRCGKMTSQSGITEFSVIRKRMMNGYKLCPECFDDDLVHEVKNLRQNKVN